MKQTQNYRLNQWEKTDRIQMEDFNGDNSKVDAALKTLANQVASKANSSTVSSLTTKVNTKADQSALTAEQTARQNADNAEKAAREAADTALRNENCWVKLSDKTLSAAASSYTWAIKNPENYAELRCVFELACTGDVHFNVQNGAAMKEVYMSGGSTTCTEMLMLGGPISSAGGYIRLSSLGGGGNVLVRYELCGISSDGDFWAPNDYLAGKSQIYKNLSTVKIFSNSGTFAAGSRFLLYGLKK